MITTEKINLAEALKWISLIGILELFFYTDILKFHTDIVVFEKIMYYVRGLLQYNAKYGIFLCFYGLVLTNLFKKQYLSNQKVGGNNEANQIKQYVPHLFFIIFLVYIIFNIVINNSFVFIAHYKLAIIAYTLPIIIGAMILASEIWLRRLLKAFIITGMIVILYVVINHHEILSGINVFSRLVVNSDTITSGRLLWFGVICGIIYLEHIKSLLQKILMLLFYVFPLISFAFLTGSRGPAIAFIVTFLLYLFISPYRFSKKSWVIIIVCALVFLGLGVLEYLAADIATRFTAEDSIRSSFYQGALKINPTILGIGMGNSYKYISISYFDYIHNIILETYIELGLFGLTILLIWLFGVFKRLITLCQTTNNIAYKFILCGFVFNLIGAMFSGNLLTQKELYFFTILALGIFKEKTKENIQDKGMVMPGG